MQHADKKAQKNDGGIYLFVCMVYEHVVENYLYHGRCCRRFTSYCTITSALS